MTDGDRERLLDLVRREMYAAKLGTFYDHSEEDMSWWYELRMQDREEFDKVVVEGRILYGDKNETEELRSTSEAERGREAQG